jgi:integrase
MERDSATSTTAIRVVRGVCPVTEHLTFGLVNASGFPLVPATVYLRHLQENVGLRKNTLNAAATALAVFFRFLGNECFWNITPGTIKAYKRWELYRTDESGRPVRTRSTAQQYLWALKGLVQYWRGPRDNDPMMGRYANTAGTARRHAARFGTLEHPQWRSYVRDSLWRVRLPQHERHNKLRLRGFPLHLCRSVWQFLESLSQRPGQQEIFYYRNRAIWAFLLMTGFRKGELCLTREEDLKPLLGEVHLVARPEDARLGKQKSGPGEVFVGTTNPLWAAVDSWILHGRPYAIERWTARTGQPDHGMLFCNRGGSPLTADAVDELFEKIDSGCGITAQGYYCSPHGTRHTIASLMLDAGVGLTEVQRFLRHVLLESTRVYARLSEPRHRMVLQEFWDSFGLGSR